MEDYVGRQKELFEVVQTVFRNRLVTLIGLPGIGKTSLAKNAVHFIADRQMFKMGVVFLPLKGYTTCEIFLKKLIWNLILQNFELEQEKKKEISQYNSEQLLMHCLQYLKKQEEGERVLIVFDNAEDLLYNDR